jgi:hypothetical protein
MHLRANRRETRCGDEIRRQPARDPAPPPSHSRRWLSGKLLATASEPFSTPVNNWAELGFDASAQLRPAGRWQRVAATSVLLEGPVGATLFPTATSRSSTVSVCFCWSSVQASGGSTADCSVYANGEARELTVVRVYRTCRPADWKDAWADRLPGRSGGGGKRPASGRLLDLEGGRFIWRCGRVEPGTDDD